MKLMCCEMINGVGKNKRQRSKKRVMLNRFLVTFVFLLLLLLLMMMFYRFSTLGFEILTVFKFSERFKRKMCALKNNSFTFEI